ncbi:MAG: EAL domain-containing protein, partial [Pseudomonadota bacterium]
GTIMWANDTYCEMFGYAREEILGRKPMEFVFPPETAWDAEAIASFRFTVNHEQMGTHRNLNVRSNGERFWNEMTIGAYTLADGQKHYILVCRDVTAVVDQEKALEETQAQLSALVRTDALTQINNRFGLDQTIDQQLAAGPLAVAQLDIDNFKDINDLYGHVAGDAILKHIARTLQATAPPAAEVYRLGGDEFLMTIPHADVTLARAAMQAFQTALGEEFHWEENAFPISTSVGIALSDGTVTSGEALLASADFALYASKNRGRGLVSIYDAPLHSEYKDRKRLLGALKSTGMMDQLEIMLQPITTTDRIPWGMEALVRWRHPTQGLLPPAMFLDLARQGGVLRDIDIRTGQLALEALTHLVDPNLRITINASPDVLMSDRFPDLLNWRCEQLRIPRERVVIEVHETTVIEGPDGAIANRIRQFAKAGYRIVLDDFGVGQAGLAHLSQLAISGLKLDRSLVSGLPGKPENQSVVRAILTLCRDLGLSVVAEGVETDAELEMMRDLDCPLIQGYLLARPMRVAEAASWLAEWPTQGGRAALVEKAAAHPRLTNVS